MFDLSDEEFLALPLEQQEELVAQMESALAEKRQRIRELNLKLFVRRLILKQLSRKGRKREYPDENLEDLL